MNMVGPVDYLPPSYEDSDTECPSSSEDEEDEVVYTAGLLLCLSTMDPSQNQLQGKPRGSLPGSATMPSMPGSAANQQGVNPPSRPVEVDKFPRSKTTNTLASHWATDSDSTDDEDYASDRGSAALGRSPRPLKTFSEILSTRNGASRGKSQEASESSSSSSTPTPPQSKKAKTDQGGLNPASDAFRPQGLPPTGPRSHSNAGMSPASGVSRKSASRRSTDAKHARNAWPYSQMPSRHVAANSNIHALHGTYGQQMQSGPRSVPETYNLPSNMQSAQGGIPSRTFNNGGFNNGRFVNNPMNRGQVGSIDEVVNFFANKNRSGLPNNASQNNVLPNSAPQNALFGGAPTNTASGGLPAFQTGFPNAYPVTPANGGDVSTGSSAQGAGPSMAESETSETADSDTGAAYILSNLANELNSLTIGTSTPRYVPSETETGVATSPPPPPPAPAASMPLMTHATQGMNVSGQGYNGQAFANQGYDNAGYNGSSYNNPGYGNQAYNNQPTPSLNYNSQGYNSPSFSGQAYNNQGSSSQSPSSQTYHGSGSQKSGSGAEKPMVIPPPRHDLPPVVVVGLSDVTIPLHDAYSCVTQAYPSAHRAAKEVAIPPDLQQAGLQGGELQAGVKHPAGAPSRLPSVSVALDPEYFPFCESARLSQPSLSYGVVKIKNPNDVLHGQIPFSTSRAEIIAFLGRNSKILNDSEEPVHIIMERVTSKTNDVYAEFMSASDAMRAVERHQQAVARGRHPRMGDRPVEVELSSQAVLMADLFPHATGVVWHNAMPEIQNPVPGEPWKTFKGFVTEEEMAMLVKHVEIPQRSPFSKDCPQRPYECMISTLKKLPWYMVSHITMKQRHAVYNAVVSLIRLLQQGLNDQRSQRPQPELNERLLNRLVNAAMRCPGFSVTMKDDIAYIAGVTDQQQAKLGLPRYGDLWLNTHCICPKPGAPLDRVEWFIALIREESNRVVNALPLVHRPLLQQLGQQTGKY